MRATDYAGIRQILTSDFDVPADRITPQSTLEDLGVDSLGVVELVDILGEQRGAPITDTTLRPTMTLEDFLSTALAGTAP
ncbi:acyl carrier protein [Streptomyces sp. NPDC127068]|uniref:acyl carrier protein n=1 Tax=Streptomyces sp. NPDC127068 TaxID=3347127 RepID=UPI00364BFDA8